MESQKYHSASVHPWQPIIFQLSLIIVLGLFILATRFETSPGEPDLFIVDDVRIVNSAHVIPSFSAARPAIPPPPPPRPIIDNTEPDNEIFDVQDLSFDASLYPEGRSYEPPPPPDVIEEDDLNEEADMVFILVEEMPELIGGINSFRNKIVYPKSAQQAGIQGLVFVRFVVNAQGRVEEPWILRGIGGGCDEAVLHAVEQTRFSPARQRGRPVHVQYTIPVRFVLR
ncbi:MAG: energy transducer TonB [Balneolaceae bacterium]